MRAVSLALLSGLLYAFSFPDPGFSGLAWIALVPFLLGVRGRGPVRGALLGGAAAWLGSMVGCAWLLQTLRLEYGFSSAEAWLFLTIASMVVALPFCGFAAVATWLLRAARPALAALGLAACWTAMEWLRADFFPRFPWMLLGASQADLPIVIQIADLGGVYAVSFVVLLVNVGMSALLSAVLPRRLISARSWREVLPTAGLGAAALLITLGYGAFSLERYDPDPRGSIDVAVVQASVPQQQRWDPAHIPDNIARHLELSRQALSARPRLLVWPEAAASFDLRRDRTYLPQLLPSLARAGTHFLTGTPRVEGKGNGRRLFNSALLLDPAGRILGRYDKRTLLPFGEYYPAWVKRWPGLHQRLRDHMGRVELSPGEARPQLHLGEQELSLLICHEVLYPRLARERVSDGSGLLLNLSNDAWFGTTGGARQHLQLAVLRAVENRRPMVRAANTGISVHIDRCGRQRERLELEESSWLLARVSPGAGRSWYGRWGDLFAEGCAVGLLCALSVGWWRQRGRAAQAR